MSITGELTNDVFVFIIVNVKLLNITAVTGNHVEYLTMYGYEVVVVSQPKQSSNM